MSEMLGNQYFMTRNFFAAETELRYSLNKDPFNKSIRKKLMLCYTQTEKFIHALRLFSSLIKEDINCIIDSDPDSEDCPCDELISRLISTDMFNIDPFNYYLTLGILWSFKDLSRSLNYFNSAYELSPNNLEINECKKIINNHLSKIKS